MVNRMLGITSMHLVEGLIFPRSLSIAGSGHPRASTITDNFPLMFNTFLADLALI